MEFTHEEIKERRFLRLAQIILDHWEEGSGMDTRYFDHPFIHNVFVIKGKSKKGGGYREHVVPRVYLRDQCLCLYDNRASINDVARVLMENLRIVEITNEEADALNKVYKTTMPDGWVLGVSDPLERLRDVGIEII